MIIPQYIYIAASRLPAGQARTASHCDAATNAGANPRELMERMGHDSAQAALI
jgi:hypothetical protein